MNKIPKINLIILILFIVPIASVLGWLVFGYFIVNQSLTVPIQLLDRETKKPIVNWPVIICDDYHFEDAPCEIGSSSFLQSATSNNQGLLILNIDHLPQQIILNLDPTYQAQSISREDNLAHHFNPNFLRVIETEKDSTVKFNKFYDLKEKTVTIQPIAGQPTTTSFQMIELLFFQK